METPAITEDRDYLNLLVPRAHYPTMVQQLAALLREDSGSQVNTALSEDTTTDYAKRIQKLKASTEVKGCARAIMDLAAERPEQWVDFSEAVTLAETRVEAGEDTSEGPTWDMRRFFTVCKELHLEKGSDKDLGSPLDHRTTPTGATQRRLDVDTARIWRTI